MGAGILAMLAGSPVFADRHDPPDTSRAQERLDRDTQRAAERAAEQAARFAEERARIESRAAEDPAKAASDLDKLDADVAKEQAKAAEDAAKSQEDFREESAKQALEASERSSDDSGGMHGSSAEMHDLAISENADHDARGFPVRRGEVMAVDLSPETLSAAERAGFRIVSRQQLEAGGQQLLVLRVPDGTEAAAGRDALLALQPGAAVDLVHYYGLGLTAGEKGKRVREPKATLASDPAVAVGVIDTALAAHPAFAKVRTLAWADGNLAAAPREHGTAVASIAVAAGAGTILSANIFRGPAERPFTSAEVIASAIDWMLGERVATINMSLAGPRNLVLDRIVKAAIARGHSIVAAAGNGGPAAPPSYPAAVPGVIAVTAVDGEGRIYRYANRGSYLAVATRGVDVAAASSSGGFARFSGTSFASPRVAAWIGRCRAADHSAADCAARLKTAAKDAGVKGFDPLFGFGILD